MQYSISNYSCHAVRYITVTYLFYNWNFAPLTPFTHFAHPYAILSTALFCFFLKFICFIYLFLAELGLCCHAQAFSSCGKRSLLFIAVRGLLVVVASLVVEHRL